MFSPVRKKQIQSALREYFSLSTLRPGQKQAVTCLLAGRDLLCVLPTGAGKSLCYQLPAMMMEGCTLVVSPLIALMIDQVKSLREKGIAAECINSLQSIEKRQTIMHAYQAGKLKLLYVSPERLQSRAFEDIMVSHPPCMLVVDEAHCVVEWGDAFRPSYRHIAEFIARLPQRPTICAMTATADHTMQKQILRDLAMCHPRRVIQPLVRANLRYATLLTIRKNEWIARYFREHAQGKGIVFCKTRVRAERLAAYLQRAVGACGCYHAGLERETRQRVQDDFTSGRLRILCATSAFGMGVDVTDIRAVIHDGLPDDLRDYAQQSGRAGRDGRSADCIVLIDPVDLEYRRKTLQRNANYGKGIKGKLLLRQGWRNVSPLLRWCFGGRCLSAGLSQAFGQPARNCGVCAVCLRRAQGKKPQLADVPRLDKMRFIDLRFWAMVTWRNHLAGAQGVSPRKLVSKEALSLACRFGELTPNGMPVEVHRELQSLLTYMMAFGFRSSGSEEGTEERKL